MYYKVMFLLIQISNPDEFDVMLSIPVDRVNIKPFGDGGAFYSVSLKRGNSPLKKFQETDTSPLSASKMLEEFRKEVKKCVEVFTGEYRNGQSWSNAVWETVTVPGRVQNALPRQQLLLEVLFIMVQSGYCLQQCVFS